MKPISPYITPVSISLRVLCSFDCPSSLNPKAYTSTVGFRVAGRHAAKVKHAYHDTGVGVTRVSGKTKCAAFQ